MAWWNRKPEDERARWELDPLVGVGPLRFGMSPDQVQAALDGAIAYVSQGTEGRLVWQTFHDVEVTAIYGPGPRLAAVALDGRSGPLVRLRGVELIDRAPSEVRADLLELAGREGALVRVNRSGDPEAAAWGLSMGARPGWALSPEGYAERTDRMVTDALCAGPELAEDPYGTEPVRQWCKVREERGAHSGEWPVRAEGDRPLWGCTPLEGVGPLRFGMNPREVAAALGGEPPAERRGWFTWQGYGAEQWNLEQDRFDGAGVTAHYWHRDGFPTLAAVTVDGRTGPRVEFEGIPLIGRPVTEVDAAMHQYVEGSDTGLRVGCAGDLGPDGTNIFVRADRAGDAVISGARFCAEDWEDHG